MANPEHVEIVKAGKEAIDEWREKRPDKLLNLEDALLGEVNLRGANLSKVDFSGADLSRADLSETNLTESYFGGANFSEANLSGSNLSGTDLRGIDFFGADLGEADLRGVDFRGADLEASFFEANLSGANFGGADFGEADLRGANLRGANFGGADLKHAWCGETVFCNVDLSSANGLETVRHSDRSTIDIDTLVLSRGQIPDAFLRGCGLAPWEVLQTKLYDSALNAAQISDLQYKIFETRAHGPLFLSGVFVSYSHADSKFVDKIYLRLQKEGAPVWLDRHDLVAGPIQSQIANAVRMNDVVVLVLSEASVESDWVASELEIARGREKKEKRDILCPVTLDEAWKQKVQPDEPNRHLWLPLKQEKVILDFSKWRTKAFNGQFGKLLRGLKVNYPKQDDVGGAG